MGLTTAHVLLERGEDVTVLEAREGTALETSFANGGMLTPSMPEPWNGPGVYRHLAASLFDPRASMKLRPSAIPSLFGWGIQFLRHSSERHFRAACADNFSLATYSLGKTREITDRLGLDYCRGSLGTLSVFRNRADFTAKESITRQLGELGMSYAVLSADEMIALVPALGDIRAEIYNGIHYRDDEHGDAHLFCRELEREFLGAGGRIEFGTGVSALRIESCRVAGVETAAGFRAADRVVVAAGTRSPALLKAHGVRLPVKPVKGYSVTVDATGIDDIPGLPVLDDAMHAGITPLCGRLRMVGTAEFAGFDTSMNKVRADNLYDLFERMLPGIAARTDRLKAEPWAGLRPVSYDGKPFIDRAHIDGLFLNCGHGPLGWTMAMGSAHLLADLMQGDVTAIDRHPFSLDRGTRRRSIGGR